MTNTVDFKTKLWDFTKAHGYDNFDTKDLALEFGKLKKLWWDSAWDTVAVLHNPKLKDNGKWGLDFDVV